MSLIRATMSAVTLALMAAVASAQEPATQPVEAVPEASPPLVAPPPDAPAPGERTGNLVSELAQEHGLLWQQAVRTFRDADEQVRKAALVEHDFDKARRLSQEATTVIERNRRYAASPEEYEAM